MHQHISHACHPLIETTIGLMAARSGGPGLREIAAAAGVSPSLINYRYGSLDSLKEAALMASLDQDGRRWEALQRDLLSAPVSRSDLAGLLNELLLNDSRPHDKHAALRWLRILRALRGGTGQPAPLSLAEQDFWALLARKLGLACKEKQLLMAFFHGLAFGHLIGAASPGFHAWSCSLVDRFTQRLFNKPVSWPGADSAWRLSSAQISEPRGDTGSTHPTHHAIREAAMQILLEEGVNALTHRRLAAASSASVSSVIHFFDGRRAILREAYGLLYRRLCERNLGHLDVKGAAGSLAPRDLAERLAARDAQGEQDNRNQLAGLLNAMFEASREPETAQLALSLFARSGETSRNLLRLLPGFQAGVSWLDAQLFRLVSNGLMFLSPGFRPSAGPSSRSDMTNAIADALTLLFEEHQQSGVVKGTG